MTAQAAFAQWLAGVRGRGPAFELHQRRVRAERHANRDQPSDPAAGGGTRDPLFVRQNRALALTPEAREYLPGIRAAFNDLRLATDRLKRRDDDHVLTVSTLASLAAKWLLPRLSAFQEAHPGIDVRITTSSSLVDFRSGDVDAAIRYGRGHWAGLRADWLMADELFPVCSPALANGDKPLRCPQDLANHTLLHSSGGYDDDWRLWLTAAGLPTDISKQPGVSFDLIFVTAAGGDRRHRRGDGPDLLCRGRYRQGAAGGSLQDRAAGGRRLLPGLAGDASGSAKAARVPAMAEDFGAGQGLKQFTSAPKTGSIGVFPVGRAARTWQIAASSKIRSADENSFRAGQSQRGEARDVANVHVTGAADQVAHRRHPARHQRQFPRAVRFLPVRLLRLRHRQGLLSRH